VLVERAVAAQIELGDAARQRGERLLDHPAVARAGRDIAVAELVGDDDNPRWPDYRPRRYRFAVAAPSRVKS
jgi:hypothetical protein